VTRAPKPVDLAQARILISNDDGIAAPGLKVLEKIARSLSRDVWVVAPELEQSGAGHSLTLRRPLRIRELGRRRFAVDGTPTDAVLLGAKQIMADRPPTLILSGVNRGANMGEDVTYSGTVAAAMEGTLLGIPSIALSQDYVSRQPVPWATAAAHGADVIRRLATVGWPANVVINLNFPACAPDEVQGAVVVRQGKRKIGDELGERMDMRGERYYWIGPIRAEEPTQPGTDIEAVHHRRIAVTPLDLDLTHDQSLARLQDALA
jgi:5'-nucleotidase